MIEPSGPHRAAIQADRGPGQPQQARALGPVVKDPLVGLCAGQVALVHDDQVGALEAFQPAGGGVQADQLAGRCGLAGVG